MKNTNKYLNRIVTVTIMLLTLFSTVVSGTYAWSGYRQLRNGNTIITPGMQSTGQFAKSLNGMEKQSEANDDDILESETNAVMTKQLETTVPGVCINGGETTIVIGQNYRPGCTTSPPESSNRPVWRSSNPEIAYVDPNTGIIQGIAEGDATITAVVAEEFDSIVVTVIPSGSAASFPLRNGEGPYAPQVGGSAEANFALWLVSYRDRFNEALIGQSGSIKLKDILNSTDFEGITIQENTAAMAGKFSIGHDKAGDAAIIYTYYPPVEKWTEVAPLWPTVTTSITLMKNGFMPATISLTLRYDSSYIG